MIHIAYFTGKAGWVCSSERYPTYERAQRAIGDQVRREMTAGLTPLPRRAQGLGVEQALAA